MNQNSPSIEIDLFSDAAIADPYPRYAEIRDAGPLVWLQNYDMWAVSRFDDVRAALKADSTLVSGHGVAMNDLVNGSGRGGTTPLVSDGEQHAVGLRLTASHILLKPPALVTSYKPRGDWLARVRKNG